MGIRSFLFFALGWLLIISSSYAVKAGINFGIISTLMSVQTPLNAVIGALYWNEKLNFKVVIGMVLTICGVTWVSLAHKSKDETPQAMEESVANQWISVVTALLAGIMGTVRVF